MEVLYLLHEAFKRQDDTQGHKVKEWLDLIILDKLISHKKFIQVGIDVECMHTKVGGIGVGTVLKLGG